MATQNDERAGQHILLTALGAQSRMTRYTLNGVSAEAELTPLALLQCLSESDRPNRVVALVTEGAKNATWAPFSEAVQSLTGIEAELVEIPEGRNAEEIRQIIERAAKAFGDDAHLTLDVTQGFRHFPFVLYALALYLTSLRGITLRGAYYGMVEGPDDPKPIVDLKPLLELPEWFHAVRVFRETGSTGSLASLLEPLASSLRLDAQAAGNAPALHQTASLAGQLREQLQKVAFAYESAMPLELGKAATLMCGSLNALPGEVSDRLPLSVSLVGAIESALHPLKFTSPPTWGGEWKTKTVNDQVELQRQAKLIDLYLDREQFPLAFGLMAEWVVSFLMKGADARDRWLVFQAKSGPDRRSAASRIGALAKAAESGADLGIELSELQREWGVFWNQLTTLRNTLHHHGMRNQAMESAPSTVNTVRSFWDRIKTQNVDLPELGGGKGTLLISAVGNRPGVLFSAFLKAQPDQALVICSQQSVQAIDEAAQRSGFTGPIHRVQMNDPFGGFDEMESVRAESSETLLYADKIVANLTGGTTLMGLMVQNLVEAGGRLNRPFRRFALIDRRPAGDQDENPWVESEHYWLDSVGEEEHADD